MKKLIVTHLLLNLYLLVLVQPALPVLEYLINYDYIVNELCENKEKPILTCSGKCYLGDQVKKQLDRDPNQEVPLPPQIEFKEFISLYKELHYTRAFTEQGSKEIPLSATHLKDNLFTRSFLRPPQV